MVDVTCDRLSESDSDGRTHAVDALGRVAGSCPEANDLVVRLLCSLLAVHSGQGRTRHVRPGQAHLSVIHVDDPFRSGQVRLTG